MKRCYIPSTFRDHTAALLEQALDVIDNYRRAGYRLSVRQLYYQLVSVNAIENSERSYKRLIDLLNNARLAGIAPFDMIEDRGRDTLIPAHWESPREILESAASSFRLDKWADQPNYVEVMVEKAALEGVLEPVCRQLDVPFTANRGYSSLSAMFDAAQRLETAFRERMTRLGGFPAEYEDSRMLRYVGEYLLRECEDHLDTELSSTGDPLLSWSEAAAQEHGLPRIVVLYLGDHDPSGIDMTRDVRERLSLLADRIPLEVHRLALNMDQVRRLRPPENPAKVTDSRAGAYIERFGRKSWELDAVTPDQLAALVRDATVKLRDESLWATAVARETAYRERLSELAEEFED